MPVLEVDGERIHDSTFIVRRLEELMPRPPLIPADPLIAARQRLLEDWCDESLYWYVMGMRWAEENAAATLSQITAGVPAVARILVGPMLRRQVGSQARAQGLGRLPLAVLERELGGLLDALVTTLGDAPFFAGDHPGVGDLALYGQIRGMCSGPTPHAERLIAGRPVLGDLCKRVEQVTSTSG
jgi:glutathione S-transferase